MKNTALRLFARIFNRLLPFEEDERARAGWSAVKLDDSHPFHRCAIEHDYHATQRHKGKPEQTQAESDLELILDMCLIVQNTAVADIDEALELAHDMCAFWPVARKFGILRSLGSAGGAHE